MTENLKLVREDDERVNVPAMVGRFVSDTIAMVLGVENNGEVAADDFAVALAEFEYRVASRDRARLPWPIVEVVAWADERLAAWAEGQEHNQEPGGEADGRGAV